MEGILIGLDVAVITLTLLTITVALNKIWLFDTDQRKYATFKRSLTNQKVALR